MKKRKRMVRLMRLTNIPRGLRNTIVPIPAGSLTDFYMLAGKAEKTTGFKHEFTNALRQSLMAYAFNIFGIVAGMIVAHYLGVFRSFPWAFIIYPPILSARGVIGGLFCGRLSTGLHLGTVQPSFPRNTKSFYLLLHATVVLTLEASILMGLIAAVLFSFSQSMLKPEFFSILTVITSTMALALVVISPLAITASFLSFKHGLNPDIVLYPVESTIADLLITLLYVGVLNIFAFNNSTGQYLLSSISLTLVFFAMYFTIRNFREREFVKTIKESLLTIILVSLIINIAGSTFGKISEIVEERREIYTVYPALIDTIGDVGSVVGSTATTKLALGVLKPSFSSIRDHGLEISSAWLASMIMYCVYSLLSLIIQGALTPPNLLSFTVLLLIANLIAASSIILVAYAVAILTYKMGFDPDNFEIPIESSMADSLTSIALLVSLLIMAGFQE
ncbi:MAG: magnesium transporter [Candidatus Brockarchaeota archaeon]|nr:magnesium transporter [Candidatus Brockarchaeota archaeon]